VVDDEDEEDEEAEGDPLILIGKSSMAKQRSV
jgi:hypothetical protein